MTGWLATILVVLPFAGALVVWLLPLNRFAAGSLALLVALAEVAFWINALTRMDFDRAGSTPNFDQHATWFSDLHVSYHVGFYAFSFWLAGLAVVVMAAAIAYAFVGVFAAQDLRLFYVFFEAMLIPLYVLVGVWGGPGRLGATVKFVIYTMAGSLLMLAAVIVYGLSRGTFDLIQMAPSGSHWLFLGFAIAFAVKAPLFPLHGWLPDAYRESPPEVAAVLFGVVSKAAIFGFIRICFGKFPGPFDDFRVWILALATPRPVIAAPDFQLIVEPNSLLLPPGGSGGLGQAGVERPGNLASSLAPQSRSPRCRAWYLSLLVIFAS